MKGILLGGVRKAYASKGDDVTLTRFVKLEGESKPHKKPRQAKLPGFENPFVQEARTKFPKMRVKPSDKKTMLVSGHNNIKIGRDVRKGHLRGYWIYTLSLEERATCPASCLHWQSCYGNNMPFADRIDHTQPDFLPKLEAEIAMLCAKRKGVLIRLHALGDFFSSDYVDFWRHRLCQHENLSIFGYTAHPSNSHIGMFVDWMNAALPKRSMIRHSNGTQPTMSTVTIGQEASCPSNAFICPEQTGKTLACATCAACWSTDKNVAFLEH